MEKISDIRINGGIHLISVHTIYWLLGTILKTYSATYSGYPS